MSDVQRTQTSFMHLKSISSIDLWYFSLEVSYRAPVVSSSHNFEGGTIRLTRHFDHSLLNESTRFHTVCPYCPFSFCSYFNFLLFLTMNSSSQLPRHSIVRLPNSDTLIEYEDEGPESSLWSSVPYTMIVLFFFLHLECFIPIRLFSSANSYKLDLSSLHYFVCHTNWIKRESLPLWCKSRGFKYNLCGEGRVK